jgi:hypothetical protein
LGILILKGGRGRRLALWGVLFFLAALTPLLGVYNLANLPLAAMAAWLVWREKKNRI